MPSSGYGVEDIPFAHVLDFKRCYRIAQTNRMETEWLGSFVAAIKKGATVHDAAWAGIEEWDL